MGAGPGRYASSLGMSNNVTRKNDSDSNEHPQASPLQKVPPRPFTPKPPSAQHEETVFFMCPLTKVEVSMKSLEIIPSKNFISWTCIKGYRGTEELSLFVFTNLHADHHKAFSRFLELILAACWKKCHLA